MKQYVYIVYSTLGKVVLLQRYRTLLLQLTVGYKFIGTYVRQRSFVLFHWGGGGSGVLFVISSLNTRDAETFTGAHMRLEIQYCNE
jgi:hypothetical protein